jgi:hypothetical protein
MLHDTKHATAEAARVSRRAAQAARAVDCPICWAAARIACTIAGPDGYHLARFVTARRAGLLPTAVVGAIIDAAGVITDATIAREMTP